MLAITASMGWDDPDLTVGKLMRLFRWFDQHTTDGNAACVTSALLDRVIGVTGFVQAVQKTGWIVVSDAGISLNHFEYHNGSSAKTRAQTAKRVANHRASEPSAQAGNAPNVTDALAREEKRREEEEIQEPSVLVAEAAPSTTYRVPKCPTDELVALYHRHLPALPAVEVMNDGRKRSLTARWRDVCGDGRFDKAAGLDWFSWFFERVAGSDFLMGRTAGKSGQHWRADFDFLTTPSKFVKVVEGRYHQGAQA